MKNILIFIKDFLSRSGSYIFATSIVAKLLSFLASWIALQLIPNKELGAVIYSFQIISFLIPIADLGLSQGLLRYGALLKLNEEKNKLFIYTLKYGIIVSLIFVGLIILTSFFINFQLENTKYYLILLSFSLITHFVFGLVKIQVLLYKNNKLFSFIDLTYTFLLVLLVALLSKYFYQLGYAIALVTAPLLTTLVFLNKIPIKWKQKIKLPFINFSFWKYGFFASLANVTTQLLFAIDIILIGSLLNNLELVTAFKYVSLIPFSLLFLSHVVITTDFVNFTEKVFEKQYIIRYIKNYTMLFSIISVACILLMYLFGGFLLSLFKHDYSQYKDILLILTFGVSGILILRGVFGNLLSSIGKAHSNFTITSIALLLNVILNYYLIPSYGILGAAITSASLMWFTGILSGIFFFYYYKKENLKS